MNKRVIILLIISIILILSIIFFYLYSQPITGRVISSEYVQTKAICNASNFCQDYIITCDNTSIINMEPITGAVIQHDSDWEDPRKNTNLCR